jgi:hypothetical protein
MKLNALKYLFIAGFIATGPALAQSPYMEVVGLSEGDILNVRSGPGASYADMGDDRLWRSHSGVRPKHRPQRRARARGPSCSAHPMRPGTCGPSTAVVHCNKGIDPIKPPLSQGFIL